MKRKATNRRTNHKSNPTHRQEKRYSPPHGFSFDKISDKSGTDIYAAKTDSIKELARFWDKHDITDFEDLLEEVTDPVFSKGKEIMNFSLEKGEVLTFKYRLQVISGETDTDKIEVEYMDFTQQIK